MMTPSLFDDFVYAPDLTGRVNGTSFYVRMPADIERKEDLFEALKDALWLPDDAPLDWDMLLDRLCDLDWMTDRKIMLVHETLPRLPDRELRLYLAILRDAMRWWRFDDPHLFEVVLPERERGHVAKLLADA